MFPIRDENPTRNISYVTLGLMALFIGLYLALPQSHETFRNYGLIPVQVNENSNFFFGFVFSQYFHTLFTAMFIHAGWQHLLTNVLFLWIFGNNIEDQLGKIKFIVIFFACGIIANMTQAFVFPHSDAPIIGSSGAISGMMGAYIFLFPRTKILTLFFVTIIRISAFWYIGIWFVFQTLQAFEIIPRSAEVAWWAHIGGFLSGLLLIQFMRPQRVFSFAPSGRRRGKVPWQ